MKNRDEEYFNIISSDRLQIKIITNTERTFRK